jgi:hypothetical protein
LKKFIFTLFDPDIFIDFLKQYLLKIVKIFEKLSKILKPSSSMTLVTFEKNILDLKMLIIQLLKTEIGLKIGSSSQKLFDFNRLKIVLSIGVYFLRRGM